jgi:hypothetical protein
MTFTLTAVADHAHGAAQITATITGITWAVVVTGATVQKTTTKIPTNDPGEHVTIWTQPRWVSQTTFFLDGQSSGSGATDLDLYLYTADDLTLVASSSTTSQDESFTIQQFEDGTYHLWVVGFAVTGTANYSLTVTGTPGEMNLYRQTPDGVQTEVRGSPSALSDGQAVFYDTELPLDTPVTYVATSPYVTGGPFVSNSVTVTGTGDGWLGDPVQPTLDVQLVDDVVGDSNCDTQSVLVLSTLGDDELFSSGGALYDVTDKARPRAVARQRKSSKTQMIVIAKSLAAVESLKTLLQSGRVLTLRLRPSRSLGWAVPTYGVDTIAVGDVHVLRVNTEDRSRVPRGIELDVTVATPQADVHEDLWMGNNIGTTGNTVADLAASGLTCSTLAATGNTNLDTAQGDNF